MRTRYAVVPLVIANLALCVLTLIAIVLLRDTRGVTDTVWIRGAVLAVVSVVTLLVAVRAVRDAGQALLRLRMIAAVQVVVIAVFVVLPSALPGWMRVEQAGMRGGPPWRAVGECRFPGVGPAIATRSGVDPQSRPTHGVVEDSTRYGASCRPTQPWAYLMSRESPRTVRCDGPVTSGAGRGWAVGRSVDTGVIRGTNRQPTVRRRRCRHTSSGCTYATLPPFHQETTVPTTPRPATAHTPSAGRPTCPTDRRAVRGTRARRAAAWVGAALLLGTSALALSACGSQSSPTSVASTAPAVTKQAGALTETLNSVTAGGFHTCGLRPSGEVACWGDTSSGQLTGVPAAISFQSVSAGSGHTCANRTDGKVLCWGDNQYNQTAVPAGTFTSVSAGGGHTCGVKTDDTVACWGNNEYRQTQAPTGPFTSVSAGFIHTCGVRADGAVACWGDDGLGGASPPAGQFTSVSAAKDYTCGVRADKTLACWGYNGIGLSAVPTGEFKQVSANTYHACALTTGGTVRCWGADDSQIFYGQTDAPAGTFKQVSAGAYHTCAVSTADAVVCWGRNDSGQAP